MNRYINKLLVSIFSFSLLLTLITGCGNSSQNNTAVTSLSSSTVETSTIDNKPLNVMEKIDYKLEKKEFISYNSIFENYYFRPGVLEKINTYDNGKIVESVNYTEPSNSNRVSIATSEQDNKTVRLTYDNKWNLIEREDFAGKTDKGTSLYKLQYEYNSSGQLIKIYRTEDGSKYQMSAYEYDEKGREISRINFDESGSNQNETITSYYENGVESKIVSILYGFTNDNTPVKTTTLYRYETDEDDYPNKITGYDSDGNLKSTKIILRDSNHFIIGIEEYDNNNVLTCITSYIQ